MTKQPYITNTPAQNPQDYASMIPARMQKTIFLVFIIVLFMAGFGAGYLTKMFI